MVGYSEGFTAVFCTVSSLDLPDLLHFVRIGRLAVVIRDVGLSSHLIRFNEYPNQWSWASKTEVLANPNLPRNPGRRLHFKSGERPDGGSGCLRVRGSAPKQREQ